MSENFGLIDGLRTRLNDWIEQSDGALRADLRAMVHYMDLTRKEPPEHLCGKMAVATAGFPAPAMEFDL